MKIHEYQANELLKRYGCGKNPAKERETVATLFFWAQREMEDA